MARAPWAPSRCEPCGRLASEQIWKPERETLEIDRARRVPGCQVVAGFPEPLFFRKVDLAVGRDDPALPIDEQHPALAPPVGPPPDHSPHRGDAGGSTGGAQQRLARTARFLGILIACFAGPGAPLLKRQFGEQHHLGAPATRLGQSIGEALLGAVAEEALGQHRDGKGVLGHGAILALAPYNSRNEASPSDSSPAADPLGPPRVGGSFDRAGRVSTSVRRDSRSGAGPGVTGAESAARRHRLSHRHASPRSLGGLRLDARSVAAHRPLRRGVVGLRTRGRQLTLDPPVDHLDPHRAATGSARRDAARAGAGSRGEDPGRVAPRPRVPHGRVQHQPQRQSEFGPRPGVRRFPVPAGARQDLDPRAADREGDPPNARWTRNAALSLRSRPRSARALQRRGPLSRTLRPQGPHLGGGNGVHPRAREGQDRQATPALSPGPRAAL